MLSRLLYPLDRKQQTMLLCLMSFGGQEWSSLLDLLPDEDASLLREKSQKLVEIPKEKRVPLMIRQLKQLMSFRGLKGLEGVEPSWLIAGFKGESPRTVAIVLMHMPSSVSRQIVTRLPEPVQRAMPSREELRSLPMPLVKLVRNRFDAKFASMPSERVHESFGFRDHVALTAKELVTVVRKIGLDELAAAFITVGKRALAAFLTRLPPAHAEELMAAVKRTAAEDQLDAKEAQAFLGRVLKNFKNTDELFQKAGLYRLARAIHSDDRQFVRQLSQRFPRAHGRLLVDYVDKVQARDPIEEDALVRIRNSIVHTTIELSSRGKVNPVYSECQIVLE